MKQPDKVERYGWTLINQPGELKYVNKSDLRVDPAYQRDLQDGKRLRLAGKFDWISFGALSVSQRPDLSLWLMDGQHRWAAAMCRDDITMVPVIIHKQATVKDEARSFVAMNVERNPLKSPETFKARLIQGDPVAIEVDRLVRESGREVSGSTGWQFVRCVGAIYKSLQIYPEAFRRVWPVLLGLCHRESIDVRLVTGMVYLERRLAAGRSLSEPKLRRKLAASGYSAVLRAIGDAAAYYHRGGDSVFAKGILKVLNARTRVPLVMEGDSE